jgi:hypothetical protein
VCGGAVEEVEEVRDAPEGEGVVHEGWMCRVSGLLVRYDGSSPIRSFEQHVPHDFRFSRVDSC